LAVIDHISSVPALIMPVKELVELFHSYKIAVVIDGAHAVGQIPIDLK
jgi:selenocysteine lyase/cysteine desulfurase